MVQRLYKKWLLVSKIARGIWETLDKQWENKNTTKWQATFVQRIHLSKECIPIAKTLYTEDLSDITFNYLHENSPKRLCDF